MAEAWNDTTFFWMTDTLYDIQMTANSLCHELQWEGSQSGNWLVKNGVGCWGLTGRGIGSVF